MQEGGRTAPKTAIEDEIDAAQGINSRGLPSTVTFSLWPLLSQARTPSLRHAPCARSSHQDGRARRGCAREAAHHGRGCFALRRSPHSTGYLPAPVGEPDAHNGARDTLGHCRGRVSVPPLGARVRPSAVGGACVGVSPSGLPVALSRTRTPQPAFLRPSGGVDTRK